MADQFLEGFLGQLVKQSDPENRMKQAYQLSELEAKRAAIAKEQAGEGGTIQEAPLANNPGLAMRIIGGMMGNGPTGRNFVGVPSDVNNVDYTSAIIAKAPALADTLKGKKVKKAGEATSLVQTFGDKERAPYFTIQGASPTTGLLVQQDASTGKFYAGGKEISAEEAGRMLTKTMPNLPNDTAEFFGKAQTLSNVFQDINKLYKDSYIGPVSGRAGRAVDLYTPFGDADRSRFRNQVAKAFNNLVYLRSGKTINEDEGKRMAEEFMNINNSPVAFQSALGSLRDEMNNLVMNRQKGLEQAGYANAGNFKGMGVIPTTGNSTPSQGGSDVDPHSAEGIKAAYQAGKLSKEQARAMIKALHENP